MLRRVVLALTFVTAFGAVGAGLTSTAAAHGGCGYSSWYPSYGGYYAAYPKVYRTYYAPAYPYGFNVYYGDVGRPHRHRGDRHHHRDRGHVSFSIGF